jgi:transposase
MYNPEVQCSNAGLAEEYVFKIDACAPHDPQKKGVVESGVNTSRCRHFVVLRPARQRFTAKIGE